MWVGQALLAPIEGYATDNTMAARRGSNGFLMAGLPLVTFIIGGSYMLSEVSVFLLKSIPDVLYLHRPPLVCIHRSPCWCYVRRLCCVVVWSCYRSWYWTRPGGYSSAWSSWIAVETPRALFTPLFVLASHNAFYRIMEIPLWWYIRHLRAQGLHLALPVDIQPVLVCSINRQ